MNNRPWHNSYPAGVPTSINPDKYGAVVELLEDSFKKFKDRDAFECMGTSMSYGELDEKSGAFASYLQHELGLSKGDRIAIQMPNLLQYPIAMFGALRAGLVIVNTNPLYTEREMEHQFNDAGVKAIVIVSNFASKLQDILSKTNIKHIITTRIGDMHSFPKKLIVNTVVKYVKKMEPSYSLPSAVDFLDALKKGATKKHDAVEMQPSDVAFLQYTGGTTGVSKGAMLTHRNMLANLEQTFAWMAIKMGESPQEVVVTALPLYHIFSLTVNCLTFSKVGAKNILITNPRDMNGFVKELSKHKFTVVTGVNTLFNGLLNNDGFKKLDFSSLKFTIGGGMAVQKFVADKWLEVTGNKLLEGYGLTETAPVVSCNPLDGTDRIGTIGLPFPSTDFSLRDDDGNEVAEGERGEICINGPQVMKGYWNREQETKDTFFDGGWLRTGDIGVMVEGGYFKIVDRKKDMILVSGFNVYPNEVEDVVALHDDVLEVACIGVPDERSTEAVKVFVVKKDGCGLTIEDLKHHCKEGLTGYKVPKHYEFRDELPKTNVGKILRRKLRE